MLTEIRLDDRCFTVELVSKNENRFQIKVGNKLYNLDAVKVGQNIYSILLEGKSFNIEITEKNNPKQYIVKTEDKSFDCEIIDAETKYLLSRRGNALEDAENTIVSPMPGKIVKIPVKRGDRVEAGQTVIIVSAMKMESEYKAGKKGVIKQVHVNEGDTIEGNEPLITIE